MPSRAFHSRGSPSQPSRFFPLNSGWKPSLAKPPRAHSNRASSSFLFILSGPFNRYGIDLHILRRPVPGVLGNLGDLLDYIIALHHFAENSVLIIEPRGFSHGYKKLAAVGVRAGVGHGENSLLGMPQRGMKLVGELVAGTAAAATLRASALNHEVGNNAMKDKAVVEGLAGFGTFGQADEILNCLGSLVGE